MKSLKLFHVIMYWFLIQGWMTCKQMLPENNAEIRPGAAVTGLTQRAPGKRTFPRDGKTGKVWLIPKLQPVLVFGEDRRGQAAVPRQINMLSCICSAKLIIPLADLSATFIVYYIKYHICHFPPPTHLIPLNLSGQDLIDLIDHLNSVFAIEMQASSHCADIV